MNSKNWTNGKGGSNDDVMTTSHLHNNWQIDVVYVDRRWIENCHFH